jgi:ankyrin repeat protein
MKRGRYYLALLVALSPLFGGCNLFTSSDHRTEDYTPVFAAAAAGDLATVRQAVDNNPTLVKVTEWDSATLLHDAVQQNHLDVAKYLLDHRADVNALTADGLSPLHMAAQNGDIDLIQLLLERGAKIDALDSKGWTPLDRAEKWGHQDAAEFLKQRGGHEHSAAMRYRKPSLAAKGSPTKFLAG